MRIYSVKRDFYLFTHAWSSSVCLNDVTECLFDLWLSPFNPSAAAPVTANHDSLMKEPTVAAEANAKPVTTGNLIGLETPEKVVEEETSVTEASDSAQPTSVTKVTVHL